MVRSVSEDANRLWLRDKPAGISLQNHLSRLLFRIDTIERFLLLLADRGVQCDVAQLVGAFRDQVSINIEQGSNGSSDEASHVAARVRRINQTAQQIELCLEESFVELYSPLSETNRLWRALTKQRTWPWGDSDT